MKLKTFLCCSIIFFAGIFCQDRGNSQEPSKKRPNVILVIIDTLRADRLGYTGYGEEISPNIDTLAGESVAFDNAVTPIPMTSPSHASIFTSLYTKHHKIYRNGMSLNVRQRVLAELLQQNGYTTAGFISVVLLNKGRLFNRGFDFYSDVPVKYVGTMKKSRGKVPPEKTDAGAQGHLEDDFKEYFGDPEHRRQKRKAKLVETRLARAVSNQRTGEKTMDKVLDWLDVREENPFFLWVHLYDPHWPYLPDEKYVRGIEKNPKKWEDLNFRVNRLTRKSEAQRLSEAAKKKKPDTFDVALDEKDKKIINALYDGEIRYVDGQIERLLSYLKEHDLYEGSVIIFMSDHGEMLGEIDDIYGHFRYLYQGAVKIPLLIKFPGIAHKKIPQLVRSIDVMPTLLSYLDIPYNEEQDGMDLMPLIKGETTQLPGSSYIETLFYPIPQNVPGGATRQERERLRKKGPGKSKLITSAKIGIITQKWKYFTVGLGIGKGEKEFLFDLTEDTGETVNFISQNAQEADKLRELLAPYKDLIIRLPFKGGKRPKPKRKETISQKREDEEARRQRLEQLKSLGYM